MTKLLNISLLFLLFACGAPTPNKESKIFEPGDPEQRTQNVIKELKEKTKAQGVSSDVFFQLAKQLYHTKAYEEGVVYIDKAIKINKNIPHYHILKTALHNRLHQYIEAIEAGTKMVDSTHATVEFYEEMAWSYAMVGNHKASAQYLKAVVRQTNRSTYIKAKNWLTTNDTLMALDELEKLDLRNMEFYEPVLTFSDLYLAQKDTSALKELIQLSDEGHFHDTLLWKHRTQLAMLQNKYGDALDQYKKMSERYPGHYEANRQLGNHYYEKGMPLKLYYAGPLLDTSMMYYKKAHYKGVEELKKMALISKKLGRYDEALEYFKKVVELAPSDSLADAEIPVIVRKISYLAKTRQLPADINNND